MEEENKKQIEEEIAKDVAKTENKVEEGKITQKQADKEIKKEVKEEITNTNKKLISDKILSEKKSSLSEKKLEDTKINKKDKKKKEIKVDRPKKTDAVVNGRNLPISTKYAVAICNYIRGKNIDKVILMLEEVEKFKKPVPMKGEIPHRKGKIMSGRYPIKAVREFIKVLKSLKANAIVNELELEKYVLFCKANIASRPYKRFGRARFKRTHVTLKLILPKKKIRKGVEK